MNVFEFVTFRAADVKDLKIDDPHPNRYPQNQGFVDPAILGVSTATSFDHHWPSLRGPFAFDMMKYLRMLNLSSAHITTESAKTHVDSSVAFLLIIVEQAAFSVRTIYQMMHLG